MVFNHNGILIMVFKCYCKRGNYKKLSKFNDAIGRIKFGTGSLFNFHNIDSTTFIWWVLKSTHTIFPYKAFIKLNMNLKTMKRRRRWLLEVHNTLLGYCHVDPNSFLVWLFPTMFSDFLKI
jgi:hypothetical protein